MNDELQHQLAELLKALLAAAQDAKAFAETQIPPLVWEKVWFGRVWHTAVTIGCLLIAWRLTRAVRWCYERADFEKNDHPGFYFGAGACSIAIIFLCAGSVSEAHDALLAWVAPRIYIVEWLISITTK
jgi:hypothetical protein